MSANRATPWVRTWPGALHSALGLGLLAYAFFHAYQNYPAIEHEEAWVARALTSSIGFALGLVILAAMLVHGVLGFASWLRHRAQVARGETTRDWGVTFQLVTGTLVAAFVAYHVVQLWPSGSGAHSSIREPYARLWTQLGHPLSLIVYVTGVSAFAFHLGHGMARFTTRAVRMLPSFVGRAVGGVLGLVLLLVFAQLVARFALGEALIPALS
jgi:succinate dehydrogenase / fumarate reductase cytochrome b subunit